MPWRFAFLRRAALPSRTADPNASNAQVDGSGTAGTDCASTGFKPAVWYCALDSNTTAPLIQSLYTQTVLGEIEKKAFPD